MLVSSQLIRNKTCDDKQSLIEAETILGYYLENEGIQNERR